ncbi:MAG: prepilin-type N-terminal cleavage/methylation domain-containing protein [Deltaproteobacteria bacterium]|nr:prepilin-type N-terminal cleavage/methylation domain-containing protein [Deltaproteobacteria bacterium]
MRIGNKGFTLIELVMVIVILAILAAVAVPRFIDLQSDARVSTAKGIGGAISGAANILHSQFIVKGTAYQLGTTDGSASDTGVLYNANVAGAVVTAADNVTMAGNSVLITIAIGGNPYTMTFTGGNTTYGPKVKYNF